VLTRDIDIRIPSVRLSDVRPSRTQRYCIETAKHTIILSSARLQHILVFSSLRNSDGVKLSTHIGCWIQRRIFNQYQAVYRKLYYGHSCYGTVIGYALYRTVTFPMTLCDLWRSFGWPTYGCFLCFFYFLLFCSQLTRALLAIAKFLVFYIYF